ncbi:MULTISPECIES: DUF6119 family protein [Pantoea]|uniref:TIGR04141 family sporadically distributed protein n=1 Tax=Candidatus Pantoea gossypiicola TaxID=2608008 RepID=A0AB34CRW5_9GAMM|nr:MULTISPECIES: DUF6119 family protein [Pantoea]KAA5933679.1 TIGR04141 family sporadically distributed protein [Pantoea sp. VH_8]KAA5938254.1 TIGR04141 family sporadically distributed protein [Pantoea sp. VH_4]KAA5990182.1 TIGR04141 family sporadically distributed protein [Pantoea sp. M_4]KAA6129027.1 TIGR04141 family sporadically distributed protein [Pantoea gossypiicola]
MSVSYNIYRMPCKLLPDLTKKIIKEGLIEQKTILHKTYQLKFYFSDKLKGNEVWWWDVFSDFFKDGIEKPHNIFYFGLLIGFKEKDPENCYLISLGKSHFYLSKFIETDFGLNVAMRIANDENILLKKSRFFCGGKSQEASSYSQFVQGSYFPGESIEHLKTKAKETDKWGANNITFSDSIQLTLDGDPTALVDVFNDIDSSLATKEIIEFPKSEKITDELKIEELDERLLNSILTENANVIIDEIQSFGASIIINNALTYFKLHTKTEGSSKYHQSASKINDIKITDIKEFINNNAIKDINKVYVKITNEANNGHTVSLKEILSITYTEVSEHYFLKRGVWNRFNTAFMKYLYNSLGNIVFEIKNDLKEDEFKAWQVIKAQQIAKGTSKDKLDYREYYFNEKMANEEGYTLLDRQLKKIPSLRKGGKDYNVEVADLYKHGALIAVKISDKPHDLIYNIQQSITTIQKIKRGSMEFKRSVTDVVLWIATTKKVKELIDINSIQFLLAIQTWKEVVEGFNLKPKIYYSHHDIPKKPKKKVV